MSGGSGGSSGGGEGSGGGLLVDGGGVWVRFSPSSLSTTTASPALSSPGEWTTALDWASMKGALHDRRLYGGSMMLATTTTATTTMEVKKTAAVAGKRNDRGSFGGRGGGDGDGEGEGKHAVSLYGLVASWPRGRFCWWGARRNSKESPKALSTEGASWSWGFSGWRMQSCNCRNQAGR